MQQNVIQHAAQRVIGVRASRGVFHRFADGDAQASGTFRVFGQHLPSGRSLIAGRRNAVRSPGFHHGAAMRLLEVAALHHVHHALQTENTAGKRQRTSPLSRAGFRGQALDARGFVVVRLRHRGVGLVAASRRNAFILVKRSAPVCRAPSPAGARDTAAWAATTAAHRERVRNRDAGRRRYFLLDELHGKNGREVLRPAGCPVPGCNGGGSGTGRSRNHVVPGLGISRSLRMYLFCAISPLEWCGSRPIAGCGG